MGLKTHVEARVDSQLAVDCGPSPGFPPPRPLEDAARSQVANLYATIGKRSAVDSLTAMFKKVPQCGGLMISYRAHDALVVNTR